MKRAQAFTITADVASRGDAFLDAWQGAPFLWDGRTRAGVDCWGLVVQFYAGVFGRHLPDWSRGDHGRAWVARTIAGEARDHWEPMNEPRNGCIVKTRGHVGIYWRGGVLHAAEGAGVIWERWADFDAQHTGTEFGEYRP